MEKSIKYFTSGLFFCLMISAIAVGQDFSATLNVAGSISGYDLTFGFNPDATDGYDEGIDSYAPPAPPPPAFDAALSWGGERYYTQILAGDGDLSEHVYDIALAYGADNLITVTWDSTGFSDMMTSCVLQDAFGGAFVNIDMITGDGATNAAFASWDGDTLSIFNAAVNTLKLNVTPTDYVEPPSTPSCVLGDVYVSEGATSGDPEDYIEIYNSGSEECSLAGFQLDDEQPFDDLTFGDVVLAPGAFWLGYKDAEGSFGSGLGSGGDIVYFGDADGNVLTVTLEASVETVDGVQLSQSFDAEGTGCYTLPTPGEANADCFTIVYGCTDSDATNYNPDANVDDGSCEYPTASCILDDVYVSEAATSGDPEDYIEIYNSGSEECSLAGFQLDDEQPFDDLTFGDVVLAPGAFWLGYKDAEGSFGSGLGSGGDIVYFGDADGNVLTVTLEASVETVDGVQLSQSFDAEGTGCYTLPTPGEENADCFTIVYGCTDSNATNYNPDANVDDGSCELSVNDSDVLPEVFALRQNYPNPFNPITTLRYDLPEQAIVNIIIYDMLGRKIAQLVSAKQEAGYRSFQWDATDMYGKSVSAGIYLYQIQAGEFVQTRKMVLLK